MQSLQMNQSYEMDKDRIFALTVSVIRTIVASNIAIDSYNCGNVIATKKQKLVNQKLSYFQNMKSQENFRC